MPDAGAQNSGDLLDMTHDEHCWRDDCTREQVALTRSDSALRPGLHGCHVGTLDDWNLGGRVPAYYDHNRQKYQTFHWPDGRKESWPGTGFVRTSNLTYKNVATWSRWCGGLRGRLVMILQVISRACWQRSEICLTGRSCRLSWSTACLFQMPAG